MKKIIEYKYDLNMPIKDLFLERICSVLSKKEKYNVINQLDNAFSFYYEDKIREEIEKIKLDFVTEKNVLLFVKIEIYTEKTSINEYDLKYYLSDLLNSIFIHQISEKTERFVIRNYCNYFNSSPMKIDLIINSNYKTRLQSVEFPTKQEPLTEQILLIDTQVNAIDIRHAMSIAYNNTKNICALLSVLLDTGFDVINSEFRIFLKKDSNTFKCERFRTGYFDPELKLVIKDNLNGMKSIQSRDFDDFWSSPIAFSLCTNIQEIKDSPVIVQNVDDKHEIAESFKKLELKTDKQTLFTDNIEKKQHFPNQKIYIPRCIRKYFKNIYSNQKKLNDFLPASRLYDISFTSGISEPTLSASYKISCIETLAKSEKLSFSGFMEEYLTESYNKKLLDYYYGNIRSGHFHSGTFSFNEYSISLLTEVDKLFKEKRDDMLIFNDLIRNCIINWVEKKILT
jgi:hypothetical protein